MMPRAAAAAPQPAVAVLSLVVDRVVKAFGGHAPLHGDVRSLVDREHFIDGPAHRAVIDNDVVAGAAETVELNPFLIAGPKAEVADDDVVGGKRHLAVANANAVARGSLSGNR